MPAVEIHQVPLSEIAHGLMKFESVRVAGTDPSERMLVTLYAPLVWAAATRDRDVATRVSVAKRTAKGWKLRLRGGTWSDAVSIGPRFSLSAKMPEMSEMWNGSATQRLAPYEGPVVRVLSKHCHL